MPKLITLTLFTMAFFAGLNAVLAQTNDSTPSSDSSYVYCNVHLTTVCFGIGVGDTLTVKIPNDFMLDTVDLNQGVRAVIYDGYHPNDDVFSNKATKICPVISSPSQCRFIRSPGTYDLQYSASQNSSVLHIHISGITQQNAVIVTNFLLGFHSCEAKRQSRECTEIKIFRDAF